MISKQEQRKQIKAAINQLSRQARFTQSELACKRIYKSDYFTLAKTVLIYNAMPKECDPAHIAKIAYLFGKKVCYPKCEADNTITLYAPINPADKASFTVGAYNIKEPNPEKCEIISPSDIELAIIPGLAFDKYCNRLGRGKGFYDRFLTETNAYSIGLCFNEQLIASVATEPHDKKVDCVVCQNRTLFDLSRVNKV